MGLIAWAIVTGVGSVMIICAPLAAPILPVVGISALAGSSAAGAVSSIFTACQAAAMAIPTP